MDRTSGQTPGQAELCAQYFIKKFDLWQTKKKYWGWKQGKSTTFNNNMCNCSKKLKICFFIIKDPLRSIFSESPDGLGFC
jgi:hypothetical protein